MSFFKKLFSGSSNNHKTSGIIIYLDADLKKNIQAKDQEIKQYIIQNNFDEDQFLYLMILNKRSSQVIVKRKLNGFQRLSQVLQPPSQQYRNYVIVGYGSQRSTIPRINTYLPLTENMKFIRSGTLNKYDDVKNVFEECHLKLHHDYLTFYKFKEIQKKVSFMPLENSLVQIINEKKHMFTVKDRFNNTIFKASSKEDMFSWIYAISQAIKIRNSQIYMNQMQDKLFKSIKAKLDSYISKCKNLKDESKIIPLDDLGRKALKIYFKKNKVPQLDIKLLSIIQTYLFMCKCRRQKGEAYSQQIIVKIKVSIQQIIKQLPQQIVIRDLSSKNQFVKTIEQIMKYLDNKYRKQIIDKKNVFTVFQNYLVEQYRQDKKIHLKSLFGS